MARLADKMHNIYAAVAYAPGSYKGIQEKKMKKTLLAAVLLAVSGVAYAGELETQRAAGDLTIKTLGAMPAADVFVPRPGKAEKSTVAADEANYYATKCSIKDGNALGVMFNRSDATLNYSGKMTFYYYDKYDQLLGNEGAIEAGLAAARESATVTKSGVPAGAAFCSVDARKAVTSGHIPAVSKPSAGPATSEEKGYGTTCRLENGEAIGVIRNYSSEILLYSGSVSFYYYMTNDMDENLSMEAGIVLPYESKIITNGGMLRPAESCDMDMSAAIR